MKNVLALFMLTVVFSTAATAQGVELTRSGCTNTLTATIVDYTVPTNDFFLELSTVTCQAPFTKLAGISIGRVLYILEKKSGGSWVTVSQAALSTQSRNFNNLTLNTTYRVRAQVRYTSGVPVSALLGNPCTSIGQSWRDGFFDEYISNEIELVNTPVSSFNIIEFSGTPNNYCIKQSFNTPVIFDGSASLGETHHMVIITMKTLGGAVVGQGGTGWIDGPVGYKDLLSEVWQINDPSWQFWAGYKYEVLLAVANVCNGWVESKKTFEVRTVACRTEDEPQAVVSVFPNPASSELRISGLEPIEEEELDFELFDLTGKTVINGTLPSPGLPIEIGQIPTGMYILNATYGGNRISQKVSIIH